jgi:hypothetical protein
MIKAGKTYSNDISSISIIIHKIFFEHKDYFKVRGSIIAKSNGDVFETKNYKLYKNRIKDWDIVR